MPSREQRHRPHLFSLSLFLFPPPIFEERRISHPPFLFSSHVLATVGETRSCSIILLIIRILSLSLSREYGEMVVQIGSLCYVRALQFQGYRFVTPFR